MKSRIPKKVKFISENKMKHSGHGTYQQMVSEDSKVVAVKWFDTRPVYLLSSVEDFNPETKCRRWSKPHSEYIEVFKPLRVSKKHFKELVREAQVVNLEKGDIYAVEDVSPADERLSILLKGKLRVTCDDTHLHFINVHQFVDSPEWEANHDQSDDVFQVTIVAEEDSIFLCWPRMKLERILRHKAMLKIVLDCIIGKDITQKLYSLNEHLSGLEDDRKRGRRDELWARTHPRSMSMDAVDTGTTGRVRSTNYKNSHRKLSLNSAQNDTIGGLQVQCWVPLVANQFPAVSPFMNYHHPSTINQQRQDSVTDSLRLPETQTPPARTRSFRKNREVKFHKNIIK
ncbi:popeye domain containing protein [Holotrichia oblita]|uniref:Popeye domain containing protein n=1 Tax=Holotrichia oblita TaxID=644536 RepID=A0ACB9THV4_HOLOL|nr:popeye domain containing protein [Holotrichia oblita]